jgi:hypothetical protein
MHDHRLEHALYVARVPGDYRTAKEPTACAVGVGPALPCFDVT